MLRYVLTSIHERTILMVGLVIIVTDSGINCLVGNSPGWLFDNALSLATTAAQSILAHPLTPYKSNFEEGPSGARKELM